MVEPITIVRGVIYGLAFSILAPETPWWRNMIILTIILLGEGIKENIHDTQSDPANRPPWR